jgi:hypothetical protein
MLEVPDERVIRVLFIMARAESTGAGSAEPAPVTRGTDMFRTIAIAALATAAGAAAPAAAQSWGFGVGIGLGPPVVYEPPPLYVEPPIIYEPAPPPVLYEPPPVVLAPVPRPVLRAEAPEVIFARLDEAGYRELGPMRQRGNFYTLTAVDPGGDLVALQISVFTGDIVGARLVQAGYLRPVQMMPPASVRAAAAPPPPPPAPPAAVLPPPPPPEGAPSSLRERLQPTPDELEEDGGDPVVVY